MTRARDKLFMTAIVGEEEKHNGYTVTMLEECKYFIVNKFDNVLKACYGDYMKLPPEEKRITHHDFVAFFK